MTVTKCSYMDLTAVLTPRTIVFPGDPAFSTKRITSLEDECSFNLYEMTMGNHTGTHIDFPAHVIKDGKASSDYSIEDLIGEGLIIEVPKDIKVISKAFIDKQSILENDFVFFKSDNSTISKQEKFSREYVYIETAAAEALVEKKVKVVGIDYISVDAYKAEELPVHKILLSNNVLIVENLELRGVDPGRCKIYIMPLNVPNMDGLPARVIISR